MRFFSVTGLVTQLFEVREERQFKRLFHRLAKLHIHILDELGYVPFSKAGGSVQLTVMPGVKRPGF